MKNYVRGQITFQDQETGTDWITLTGESPEEILSKAVIITMGALAAFGHLDEAVAVYRLGDRLLGSGRDSSLTDEQIKKQLIENHSQEIHTKSAFGAVRGGSA